MNIKENEKYKKEIKKLNEKITNISNMSDCLNNLRYEQKKIQNNINVFRKISKISVFLLSINLGLMIGTIIATFITATT